MFTEKTDTSPENPGPVTELASGIFQLQIPLSDNRGLTLSHLNSYLIQGTSGWMLIDTGWDTPDAYRTMLDALAGLKLGLSDIGTIVLTHSHPDHFGMAGKIKQQSPGTKILIHRWEADIIESRYMKPFNPQAENYAMFQKHGVPPAELELLGASMPVLPMVTAALPDRVLYGGESLDTGVYELEVIWTPGHSPGHICLFEPKNRLLFCGDHLLPTITPNVGFNLLSGDNPLGDYFCALRKLQNLAVSRVYPGHEYSYADMRGRIQAIIEHHQQREKEIQNVIISHLCSSYEIASHLTWNYPLPWDRFPAVDKRLAVNETIAHLEHMRWSGQVEKVARNNRILYGAT
jgi:glyoxylase-like metal-dependent hydrolase (beta-lactamase superfamily II)